MMSLYYAAGSETTEYSPEQLKQAVFSALDALGERNKVLAIPPDYTRYHSRAGEITRYVFAYYGDKLAAILPALGTHFAMTAPEIEHMFPGVPASRFRVHDWRQGLVTLGEVPGHYVAQVSEGLLDYSWPAQVDRLLVEGGFDLILSIGQVVPHEVVGMANYNKNIFVGTGGADGINKSHFLGAVYGMERMMGRADTPVRRVLNYASDNFARHLPIVYMQTVVSKNEKGKLALRGLFVSDTIECFEMASELSLKVNFQMMETEIRKAVVYLDPSEFKSTWLGNKSVYRTRMALADGGELIVLAPGVREFGEDPAIDKLIRKYGYVGTPKVLQAVKENEDLAGNLSAAAHLIHGSSEERFSITYCPGHLTREEVESVSFRYADLDEMTRKYDSAKLKDGVNIVGGEEIFFISNPALGLWSYRGRFQ
ncbi:MAG TPA: lactate racemase domain-containing protein [Bryobacteraceae bacterium]|nr:lactate racemase domain-containing protein [Bryobacteraceae bacterium]